MEIWHSDALVAYPEALTVMEQRVADITSGAAPETLWFLEHPPLYTAGTSADGADLLGRYPFPVYDAGRGGQYTYHGPGQRVVYTMLDLKERGRDVRRFVHDLEDVIIRALARFDVQAERRDGRVGVWVVTPAGEKKIAALGIRVRRWVSFHGIAINVEPNLQHFEGIVPCGLADFGVTSLADLGRNTDVSVLDDALEEAFLQVFKVDKTVRADVPYAASVDA